VNVEEREQLVAEYLRPLAAIEPAVRRPELPARRRSFRHRNLAIAAGLLILLAVGVATVALRHPAPPAPARPPVRPLTSDRVVVFNDGISIRPWGRATFQTVVTSPMIGSQVAPDGSALAFMTVDRGRCTLELMSLVDTSRRPLATCDDGDVALAKPSRARSVTYAGTRFALTADSFLGPSWSPDSHRVAYICHTLSRSSLCITDLAGRTTTISVAGGFSPVWSPDGSAIAYLDEATRHPPNGYGPALEAWLVAPDGSGLRRASRHSQVCCAMRTPYLAWSADGRRLLVLADLAEVIDVATRTSVLLRP
jgi:hypothetical protein